MVKRYEGIPKSRRAYIDSDGHVVPLDKRGTASHYFMVASSGTLLADGHLIVSGTQFNADTVVTASYNAASAGTAPIAIVLGDGTVTFKGDADTAFYYVAVNLSA